MDIGEKLKHKNELLESEAYKEIRQEVLNYIIELSGSSTDPERIRGMLLVLKYIDSWKGDYERYITKKRNERE